MNRVLLRVLLLGAIGSAPAAGRALAQPAPGSADKKSLAKQYVDAGLAAQEAGDYDTAITFYRKAYQVLPHPALLFNMAQAHRLAGHLDQALALYKRYLSEDPSGAQAAMARGLLAELEARRAEQTRIADARKAEQARIADARKAEQARAGDARRPADEQKAGDARRAGDAREGKRAHIADARKAEQGRSIEAREAEPARNTEARKAEPARSAATRSVEPARSTEARKAEPARSTDARGAEQVSSADRARSAESAEAPRAAKGRDAADPQSAPGGQAGPLAPSTEAVAAAPVVELHDPAPRPGSAPRIAGLITGAGGVAAVGIGIGFGLHARSLSGDLSRRHAVYDPDKIRAGERANTIAIVGLAGGAALIATGAALYWWGHAQDRAGERVSVAPLVGERTAGLIVSGALP